jgi:hypothetical protein
MCEEDGGMVTFRSLNHPDVSQYVVHLTGRPGSPGNGDAEIAALDAPSRLAAIAETGEIRAFDTFCPVPFVSFTESTKAGVEFMVRDRGYAPWGIVFRKEFVWERDGGPVLYIRADEWDETRALPPHLLGRMVRIDPAGGIDWMWEREWRARGTGAPPRFVFSPADVVALLVGTREGWPPDGTPEVVHNPVTGDVDVDWGIPEWIREYRLWVWDPDEGFQVVE